MEVPLMPKGVEHITESAVDELRITMEVPLMPKGVEHEKAAQSAVPSIDGSTFDAERR